MPIHSPLFTIFFAPLLTALKSCTQQRHCPSISDSDWLLIGALRALQNHPSGRAFLQQLDANESIHAPAVGHFFESLKSQRRLGLCAEVNTFITQAMTHELPDVLATFEALANFDIYAGDGHSHESATHDARNLTDDSKLPVSHFYTLNLRTHALAHLTVADSIARKREHDMRALKRTSITTLRNDAKKGRKVLYIWDRAGIDFRMWYNLKQSAGIYFISREKVNMSLETISIRPFDKEDALNAGVQSDELVSSSSGVMLRRVVYRDEARGEEFIFLTTEMTLAPGIIAHLYKMRWDIEKVFDELKNKMDETKAWASSITAKSMQAQFLCMVHNLLKMLEHHLEKEHTIRNEAEKKRRNKRFEKVQTTLHKHGRVVPLMAQVIQRITQCSVKLIRWVRCHLFSTTRYNSALKQLQRLYATL